MAKRILLCLSHAIEEYDQLKLLHGLGYEVASIGGYIDPAHPHVDLRPALPEIPCVRSVKDAVDSQRGTDNLGDAQSKLPQPVVDWLGDDGIVIFHHYLARLFGQWEWLADWRDGGGRVIWRTVGQSVEANELEAAPYRADGLEVVRYSPKERSIPGYVGEDALIRFYKDPFEWGGWHGEDRTGDGQPFVTNFTQKLLARHPYTNCRFWEDATVGFKRHPGGPGSERLVGGLGEQSYSEMRDTLRAARCYLYTGTQPASYTLGLLEALMTGVPVVSIGPSHMQVFPYGPDLFEGHELAGVWSDDPKDAHAMLRDLLDDRGAALALSQAQRGRIAAEFGREVVAADWLAYLGAP